MSTSASSPQARGLLQVQFQNAQGIESSGSRRGTAEPPCPAEHMDSDARRTAPEACYRNFRQGWTEENVRNRKRTPGRHLDVA